MPSIQSSSLSLALLAAGHLHARCITPPNQTATPHSTDRIRFLTTGPQRLVTTTANLTTLYQAAVTLFATSSPADKEVLSKLCPALKNLNPTTTTWNTRTSTSLALVAFGAYLRLSAYGGLGRNFTFQLAKPDQLVTEGVYKYLQHPSYTGVILVLGGYLGLAVNRFDTPLATLVPSSLVKRLREWQGGLAGVLLLLSAVVFSVRIRDEERMLKERFGETWEGWHAKTARLIPFVF